MFFQLNIKNATKKKKQKQSWLVYYIQIDEKFKQVSIRKS